MGNWEDVSLPLSLCVSLSLSASPSLSEQTSIGCCGVSSLWDQFYFLPHREEEGEKPPNTVNKLTREKDIRQTCKSTLVKHLSVGLSVELAGVDGARKKGKQWCARTHTHAQTHTPKYTHLIPPCAQWTIRGCVANQMPV